MITALIFAGGTGQRMNTRAKPKQFLELHGKPVIIYTLEHFERHTEIDSIVVVCIKDWINVLKQLIKQYDIKKVCHVVSGGDRSDRSIFNGLQVLERDYNDDDIVLIHDGVRPLINDKLISANIAKAKEYGTAITVEQTTESVVQINANNMVVAVPPRDKIYTAKAPQSFRFGFIWNLYQRAQGDGISTIDSAHLCSIYGAEMHTVLSTPNNIKITMPQDYYIFRALFEAMENQQIFGF